MPESLTTPTIKGNSAEKPIQSLQKQMLTPNSDLQLWLRWLSPLMFLGSHDYSSNVRLQDWCQQHLCLTSSLAPINTDRQQVGIEHMLMTRQGKKGWMWGNIQVVRKRLKLVCKNQVEKTRRKQKDFNIHGHRSLMEKNCWYLFRVFYMLGIQVHIFWITLRSQSCYDSHYTNKQRGLER